MNYKRIVTIILNWNNGGDTIGCLESLQNYEGQFYTDVVLCDNASTDNSIVLIEAWTRKKSISLRTINSIENSFSRSSNMTESTQEAEDKTTLILIKTGSNLGFAGGNNVGIRYALQNLDFTHILLLNNDAIASESAINFMISRMELDPHIGLCGCKVAYHHTPDRIQALGGGKYSPLMGRCKHIGVLSPVNDTPDQHWVEGQLNYVLGAAIMVSKQFLDDVGLLDERYFLYFEELDWAIRGKKLGYSLGYAEKAIIYHKEGKTIGSSSNNRERSSLSEYYLSRNRIKITAKFYPYFIPTVIIYSCIRAIRFFIQGDKKRFTTIMRAVLGLSRV